MGLTPDRRGLFNRLYFFFRHFEYRKEKVAISQRAKALVRRILRCVIIVVSFYDKKNFHQCS
jgi:hypothetical protein